MKKVIVYIAENGEQFTSAKACEQYEADGCIRFSPIPTYCDHRPMSESDLRWMLSGDGDCYYATATKRSDQRARPAPRPKWATHLVYFEK